MSGLLGLHHSGLTMEPLESFWAAYAWARLQAGACPGVKYQANLKTGALTAEQWNGRTKYQLRLAWQEER